MEEADGDKKKATLPEKITEAVSHVAEELENVIHMVGHDQFAYVQKIDEEETASEKTCESEVPSRKVTPAIHEELKRMASVRETDPIPSALRRTFSSPHIV